MKIICIGRNYSDHIKELSNERPKEPVVIIKPDSSIIAKNQNFIIFLGCYRPFASLIYTSRAPVMEGAFGMGAWMSKTSPASLTASAVVGPNAAIRVLFCLNSGKFTRSELMPDGLKNAMISYTIST